MKRAAVSLAAVCLLTCSLPLELHLYNNKPRGVAVTYRDRLGVQRVTLHTHQTLDFLASELKIGTGTCVLVYTFQGEPPPDYIDVGALSRHVRLQLEPDGRMFVLRSKDRAPVNTASYAQPEGFPLVPTKECGER